MRESRRLLSLAIALGLTLVPLALAAQTAGEEGTPIPPADEEAQDPKAKDPAKEKADDDDGDDSEDDESDESSKSDNKKEWLEEPPPIDVEEDEETPPPVEVEHLPKPEQPVANQPTNATAAGATANTASSSTTTARVEDEEVEVKMDDDDDRFRFGSYGRLQFASNLDGGLGTQTRIVYPAPRVDESAYAELELGYLAFKGDDGVEVDTVTTLALNDQLFHFNGEFESTIAIRNLYAEARNVFVDGSFIWVGSRMYRGDDVYLLDFWPLDSLNTYGGGLGWRGDKTTIGLHTGVNRLTNAYQYQVVDVVEERFVGAREVVFMDRVRSITSIKAEQRFGGGDDVGMKVKLYGEFHALPEGTLRRDQPRSEETLPADQGWLVGLQLGTWNILNERSFVNVFARISGGLAAYGETAIPYGINDEKTSAGALQFLAATSMNFETEYFGVLAGGMVRYFQDADGFEEDYDDGWDLSWSVRPMALLGYFTPGVEVSHQLRRPNGLSPVTGVQEAGNVWKLSVLPALTFGEGMYARPQIRLNYTVSFLDDAAQGMYPMDDRRRENDVEHFLGAAVEWWFNSSSYE